MNLIISDGEPIDPEHEIPDIDEYWRARKNSVLKDNRPKDVEKRVLEDELFALPPGSSYVLKYEEWVRVSRGIRNPYTYMKSQYGSAIVCTRNTQGLVVFTKIDDEDIFNDYKEDRLQDQFEEKYIGCPVPVEIGDYWYTFSKKKIGKLKIIAFDKEKMRYTLQVMGYSKKIRYSKPVPKEGFFRYGKTITVGGVGCAPAYPYSPYFDKLWFAYEMRTAMFYKQTKVYYLFRCIENISNPDALTKMHDLTEKYIADMYEVKHKLRAEMMGYKHRAIQRKKQLEAGKNEKWLD